MNFRLQKPAAFIGALMLVLLAGCDRIAQDSRTGTNPQSAIRNPQLVFPEHGIYAGAYAEFGDREDSVTLEKIAGFDRLVGKEQALVASSSYWGEGTFPKANMELIARYGAVPLVFWSPWDRPYVEGLGPDKYSLTRIIAGEHDAYIDMWADAARAFAWPLIVSFANEPNGSWFPWSGVHYGGESLESVENADDEFVTFHYEGPEIFKRAWRHVVDRVRARGAKNVQFVLHLMDYSDPQEEWNLAESYYPGADYVDWLGFSLYGDQFAIDEGWAEFFPLFDWPYTELCLLDPQKPIMVCEWGCGEFPGKGSKAQWIRDGFRWMKDAKKYPRLKACVFWHERWQNEDGLYSNLRVNSTPESQQAYREGVGDSFFLGRPILK